MRKYPSTAFTCEILTEMVGREVEGRSVLGSWKWKYIYLVFINILWKEEISDQWPSSLKLKCSVPRIMTTVQYKYVPRVAVISTASSSR